MQAIATELNQTETAFAWAISDGKFAIRWFTPTREEDLCGHATLAAAHVLWETGVLSSELVARFESRSGVLVARRAHGRVELDFPAERGVAAEPPQELLSAIGCRCVGYLRSRLDHLLLVEDEEVVRTASPDFGALITIPGRGVIVTAASNTNQADFVSRFFSPKDGIAEDPVTGSAHCTLGPFWADKLGRTELIGQQLSARGGLVRVRVAADRVFLSGDAVTVLRGYWA